MIEEESKEDPFELINDLPECFMMTWEELMDRTSTTTTGYDIWNEELPEPKNYSNGGDTSNPNQVIQHSQMGGDTLNPNQTTQYLQMGGDTSNPNQMAQHP